MNDCNGKHIDKYIKTVDGYEVYKCINCMKVRVMSVYLSHAFEFVQSQKTAQKS